MLLQVTLINSNTKRVLVALIFNGLMLHHLFFLQAPINSSIFQLIAMLDLIDIDILIKTFCLLWIVLYN